MLPNYQSFVFSKTSHILYMHCWCTATCIGITWLTQSSLHHSRKGTTFQTLSITTRIRLELFLPHKIHPLQPLSLFLLSLLLVCRISSICLLSSLHCTIVYCFIVKCCLQVLVFQSKEYIQIFFIYMCLKVYYSLTAECFPTENVTFAACKWN